MVCTEILPPPTPRQGHFVELFRPDERRIAETVGRFVADGLRRGSGALVIARADHGEAIVAELARLRAGPAAAARNGRLVVLDAEQVLAWISNDGTPDPEQFRAVVASALEDIEHSKPRETCRVYSELGNLLRGDGPTDAALVLEVLWNELLEEADFHLLCGYTVDVLDDAFRIETMDPLFRTHTHVISTADEDGLAEALRLAMERILGPGRTAKIKRDVRSSVDPPVKGLPETEATIQWLKDHLPAQSGEILKLARGYALV